MININPKLFTLVILTSVILTPINCLAMFKDYKHKEQKTKKSTKLSNQSQMQGDFYPYIPKFKGNGNVTVRNHSSINNNSSIITHVVEQNGRKCTTQSISHSQSYISTPTSNFENGQSLSTTQKPLHKTTPKNQYSRYKQKDHGAIVTTGIILLFALCSKFFSQNNNEQD